MYIGCNPKEIPLALKSLLKKTIDRQVYITWSTAGIPIIKADLDNIIEFFDDVTCVAFEKFIFNPMLGYIIEIRSGGEITIGLVKPYQQIIDVADADYIEK